MIPLSLLAIILHINAGLFWGGMVFLIATKYKRLGFILMIGGLIILGIIIVGLIFGA